MCPDTPQESASLPSDEGTPSGIEQRQDGVDATQLPAATGTPVLSPAECAQQLAALFPALFGKRARPLKLRIQADIQARAPGVFTKAVLSAFLRRYTGSTSYLQSLAHSTERFDLDGNPAGELSEEHREQARQEVQRRRALREEPRSGRLRVRHRRRNGKLSGRTRKAGASAPVCCVTSRRPA